MSSSKSRWTVLQCEQLRSIIVVSSALLLGPTGVIAKVAAASPAAVQGITIHGASIGDAGITDGMVDETVGRSWNGWRVLNDRQGKLPWLLDGQFPSAQGKVFLNGKQVQVTSGGWSTYRIRIDPTTYVINTTSWQVAPTRAVDLVVQDNSGRTIAATKVDIAPAIDARVYGQCTWWVAYRRLSLGLSISNTAYGNYEGINAGWVPHWGDQLQWPVGGGKHTAIIEDVRKTVSGSITTYDLTISERNADAKNGPNTYHAYFKVSGQGVSARVIQLPSASFSSATATVYYPWYKST